MDAPYIAYLTNLPYDVDENEISYFFKNMKVCKGVNNLIRLCDTGKYVLNKFFLTSTMLQSIKYVITNFKVFFNINSSCLIEFCNKLKKKCFFFNKSSINVQIQEGFW